MATEATWQRTDATMTMEHYRAMCVRYRDDTATRMQWISRMQLQPVELFADECQCETDADIATASRIYRCETSDAFSDATDVPNLSQAIIQWAHSETRRRGSVNVWEIEDP
jgi:hypothetical protein